MKLIDKLKLEKKVEEIANYDLQNNNIAGTSYFVWQNGETVCKKHFGKVSLNSDVDVSDKTMYRMASMTKPITTVALMILVDRGLVSLDDEVSKYIPEFSDAHIITEDGKDLGKTKTPVTILHCLSHSAGFGCMKEYAMTDESRQTKDAMIKCYLDAGLDFEPFTKDMYSGWGAHGVVAKIIEVVTGEDFGEFLKKEIFIPCDMQDTTFSPTEEQWKRFIMMHDKVDGKNAESETYPGCVFENFPCEHNLAGAGLASTIEDYSKFAIMLCNMGEINGKRIVSEEAVKKISTPYIKKTPLYESESWGLSVRIITDSEGYAEKTVGKLPVGSYGWSGAYGTHFWVDPENKICAVHMKNSRFDGGAASVSAQRLERAVWESLI